MTLVAALKMEQRIVMLSDTQITNRDGVRTNALPGRLKAIVLNERMTVAYAGLSSQALDAIRTLARSKRSTAEAVEYLVNTSQSYDGEVDFILCSHESVEAPRMVKIAHGVAFEGADFYWIGNQSSAAAMANLSLPPIDLQQAHDTFFSVREAEFTRRFHEYLYSARDPNVGGAMVNCLCSPHGHCYQNHAGSLAWEVQLFPPVPEHVRLAEHKSGRNSFSYHVYSAADRGVAVVGIYLEQPAVGYLHVPLEQDEAVRLDADDQGAFLSLVTKEGAARHSRIGAG